MRESAEIVIIGAGIMGLSIAYNLARHHGKQRIVVVDASYLCGGASGRNGGGVRAQWSSETNVRLMQESLELCHHFAKEHRINTWFREGGYLFLARSEEHRRELEKSVALQNECGLVTRLLEPREISKVVPELSLDGVIVASHNPYDAVVFPWPFVWGYAEGARALGVEIMTFTRVTAIETRGRAITAVVTERGRIETSVVVNAAGAWSPEIARLVGVELPTHPHRHEICSSEPLKPWLGPLVADLSDGLYFSQSTRGELVGGIGNERVPAGPNQDSSVRFLALYSRALLRACPVLGAVRVLRQWAGLYDISPDQNPIVGSVDALDGFFLASGFMGHGFMMAPVMGKLIAQHIAEAVTLPLFKRWNLRRFAAGELLSEGMIIG
ncbi:MAG: FAD-binding oxidoreductase [Sorangiineae bacterium]|nr:FAD-binding oxidoreductase [Polyangiaceae bacterium]MEB2323452.1 FAD-binding oxidoreductase [Sorangiineae bacterium]